MTRTEARTAARLMAKAGFKLVEIVEDVTHHEIYVQGHNRCWTARRYMTLAEAIADTRDELVAR
jgi:hypothetical protein